MGHGIKFRRAFIRSLEGLAAGWFLSFFQVYSKNFAFAYAAMQRRYRWTEEHCSAFFFLLSMPPHQVPYLDHFAGLWLQKARRGMDGLILNGCEQGDEQDSEQTPLGDTQILLVSCRYCSLPRYCLLHLSLLYITSRYPSFLAYTYYYYYSLILKIQKSRAHVGSGLAGQSFHKAGLSWVCVT